MSLVSLRRCPVLRCKYNTHPVLADSSQIKRHLKDDHDYKEKQETAFSLGLINSIDERRSPIWFVNSLSDFSRMEKTF